jgi:hypothetical protein
MSRANPNVRLFESDSYSFKRWIDPADADEMLLDGTIEPAYNAFTGAHIGYKLRGFQKPTNREDPTSISFSEMLVNAGVPPKPQVNFIDPNHEKSVRAKVRVWPKCWDQKSAPSVSYA